MGLFSFFNRRNGRANVIDLSAPTTVAPDIPESTFIEKEPPEKSSGESPKPQPSVKYNIEFLFAFLEKNYESKGYDDALINPDSTHLAMNIELLKNDLLRNVRKIKTYYRDLIKDIDFHITSRSRNGMVDTVEELQKEKEKALAHISQVEEIEADANNERGPAQGMILSYTYGFRNGLAAISHHNILKGKL